MTESKDIKVTADGLVVLRSDPKFAHTLNDHDPHAQWFVTEAGKQFVELATSLDPIYISFNLARFNFMTAKMKEAVPKVDQVVIAGAGYDTRPLWLEVFRSAAIPVFEIDQPHVLESKRAILTEHHIQFPSWFQQVPADLSNPNLLQLLTDRGYKKGQRTLLQIEGVLFFLSSDLVRQILQREWLDLGKDSVLLFDYWTNERISFKNAQFKKRIGSELFGGFPFGDRSDDLVQNLHDAGFSDVHVQSLDSVAMELYEKDLPIETPNGWRLVHARI